MNGRRKCLQFVFIFFINRNRVTITFATNRGWINDIGRKNELDEFISTRKLLGITWKLLSMACGRGSKSFYCQYVIPVLSLFSPNRKNTLWLRKIKLSNNFLRQPNDKSVSLIIPETFATPCVFRVCAHPKSTDFHQLPGAKHSGT